VEGGDRGRRPGQHHHRAGARRHLELLAAGSESLLVERALKRWAVTRRCAAIARAGRRWPGPARLIGLHRYPRSWLRGDLLAGVTMAAYSSRRSWRTRRWRACVRRRGELVIAVSALAGVLAAGILYGVLIAIAVPVAELLLQVARLHGAILGLRRGTRPISRVCVKHTRRGIIFGCQRIPPARLAAKHPAISSGRCRFG
jgi:hypothetical protein